MAISSTQLTILRSLHAEKKLPQNCSILEIGEANIYNDVTRQEMMDVIAELNDPAIRKFLYVQLDQACHEGSIAASFRLAKIVYEAMFQAAEMVAIDLSGTSLAQKLDLNGQISLGRQFDVAFNHGTAEHIFNVAMVFKTMHDHCKPGGLMIHEAPFTGWVDHGFYAIQPTLYYDIADANDYEMVLLAIEHIESKTVIKVQTRDEIFGLAENGDIPNNALLFVVLRKQKQRPFAVPMQGYYAGTVSEAATEAWKTMR